MNEQTQLVKFGLAWENCDRRVAIMGLAGLALQITGCGGGSGVGIAGLSSGGTGSFTTGTITGLGSIIVNGIRYNDDNAVVQSLTGLQTQSSALDLGMVVMIEGSAVTPPSTPTGLPTAIATRITYVSEWVGPVSQVNAVTRTFQVLGHTVDVLATTIISGLVTQLSALTDSHYVEIYGYVNQTDGHIQASRIEVTASQPSAYRLSGAISQIDAIAKTATFGFISLAWANTAVFPADVLNGDFVRVELQSVSSNGVWLATQISKINSPLTNLDSGREYEGEVHGNITAYNSTTSFAVNSIPVNAAGSSIAGTLGLGVQVEVKGSIRSGVLYATEVQVKTTESIENEEFEFYGTISNVTSQSFVVRGLTFAYDSSTRNVSVLARNPLPYVEVKAHRNNGYWFAYEIDLED